MVIIAAVVVGLVMLVPVGAVLCLFASMRSSQLSQNYGPYEQPIKTKK